MATEPNTLRNTQPKTDETAQESDPETTRAMLEHLQMYLPELREAIGSLTKRDRLFYLLGKMAAADEALASFMGVRKEDPNGNHHHH